MPHSGRPKPGEDALGDVTGLVSGLTVEKLAQTKSCGKLGFQLRDCMRAFHLLGSRQAILPHRDIRHFYFPVHRLVRDISPKTPPLMKQTPGQIQQAVQDTSNVLWNQLQVLYAPHMARFEQVLDRVSSAGPKPKRQKVEQLSSESESSLEQDNNLFETPQLTSETDEYTKTQKDSRYAFGHPEDDANPSDEDAEVEPSLLNESDSVEDTKNALRELYGDEFKEEDGEGEPEWEEDAESDESRESEEENDDKVLQEAEVSRFEQREAVRRDATRRAEEARLFDAPWHQLGEVSAKERPKDGLLDLQVEFEHAARAPPVITQQLTEKLEGRIRQRIKDENFDDVERRVLSTNASDLKAPDGKAPDTELEGLKSKQSLVDLYEKEYLEKQRLAEENARSADNAQHAEPLTEVERDELRSMHLWKRISQHLDALTNFYFTPLPSVPEMDVRVRAVQDGVAAVSTEISSSAVVDGNALAPQDIFRTKQGTFSGVQRAEMTPKERKRLRRAMKTTSTKTAVRKEAQKRSREKAFGSTG